MKIITKILLNHVDYEFTIEEADDMEALHKAIVISSPRRTCDVCGESNKIKFTSNKDKEGNIYINSKCICGARSKLGRYKTSGYFWRNYELYDPTQKQRQ